MVGPDLADAALARSKWNEVWDRRAAPPQSASVLGRLMTGAGLDSGFAPFTEDAWRAYVLRISRSLEISPGEHVFEVGCGAGAFLYELSQLGASVAGIDRSRALVETAAEVMPAGDFSVLDAAELAVLPPVEVVLSASVFQYFDSLEYAYGVLNRMVAKATRVVALLDLPDLATRQESVAERVRLAGGAAAYAQRYEGLDHLFFDRADVVQTMSALGLRDVHVETQQLTGHDNARFRFSAWGFC